MMHLAIETCVRVFRFLSINLRFIFKISKLLLIPVYENRLVLLFLNKIWNFISFSTLIFIGNTNALVIAISLESRSFSESCEHKYKLLPLRISDWYSELLKA